MGIVALVTCDLMMSDLMMFDAGMLRHRIASSNIIKSSNH
jgi:hypothetical protein